MIEPRTLKGFRDFLPQQAKKRQYVIKILTKVFESYGFEPLETPVLEYEDILSGKYGEEGDKLMYRFTDNGDRSVAMRYDQTVPLARVVAQHQNSLVFPFKRYQIQNVWRAENTQKGRFREFIQCDIDTVGSQNELADAEILSLVAKAYSALGFSNFSIIINDRKIFAGFDTTAITIIDKLKKIGEEAVIKELKNIGVSQEQFNSVKNAQVPESLGKIQSLAYELGVDKKILQFDPTLARGLDYYTGLIFEVVCDDYPVGSLCGGGRYDKLIGMFSSQDIPAVGCAFGFDRTIEAMDALSLFPRGIYTTNVLVTVFSKDLMQDSVRLCAELREKNINAEMYLDLPAKMEKQLKYAHKKEIPYVILLGSDEIQNKTVTLKNMQTGEQKTISQEELTPELFI